MRPDISRIALRTGKLAELLFFPSFCRICSALLDSTGERVVCRRCLAGMTARRSGFCLVCGRFFEGEGDPHICGECQQSPPAFSRHRSCASYRGIIKDVILLFKFRGYSVLGDPLARFMNRTLDREEDLWWGVDVLVPVPLHPRRRARRGFNQAAVLARRLGRLRELEVVEGVLIRKENRAPQSALSAVERRKNIRGAFGVKNRIRLKGKTVLLVDDVFTTGTTLEECARILKRDGVREVRAVTAAQA